MPEKRSLEDRTLFRGVFLVAFATLLLELTVIRVLSFTIWYHFAYVVISTALLGYAAAGSLLAVWPQVGRSNLGSTLARACLLAGVTAVGVLLMLAWVPLHPMELSTVPSQKWVFFLYQVAVTVPFFFSGFVVSLAMRTAAEHVDRLYFWDLVGGGFACVLAVALMNSLTPPGAVLLGASAFAFAALVFSRRGSERVVSLVVAAIILCGVPFASELPFPLARSKHMALAMEKQAMVPIFTKWTALFRTDVVERTDESPPHVNHDNWGMSKSAPADDQPPWGFVMHDGTAGTGIYDLRDGELRYLDSHILKFPYLIIPAKPDVLVIGVGGGRDVFAAMQLGAQSVTGVELDPVTIDLIEDNFSEREAGFFTSANVELVPGEGRHFAKRTDKRFNLIQITGVDTLSAQSSGAYVLAENYLYTVEAFGEYFNLLKADGLLSITTGQLLFRAPQAAGRFISVAREALREIGVTDPTRHIAVVGTHTLLADVLIQPKPFSDEQIRVLKAEAARLNFPILVLPDGSGKPVYQDLVSKEGADREALLESMTYQVGPVWDDSPFFFMFFRWADAWSSSPNSPNHTSELGQQVLLFLLVSLSGLGAVFVLGPLFVLRRRGIAGTGREGVGILLYFLALGLGFMLFEISLIQRFILFLGYPTYSLTVVLFTILTCLGLGSFFSARWVGREPQVLPVAFLVLCGLAAFYMFGLGGVQDLFLASTLAVRVGVSIVVLAPLGFVLGMFLPLGIRRAVEIHEDLVPWAWAVNGCASVTGTVLTVVLAMSYGFQNVWLLSLFVYAIGIAAFLGLAGRSRTAA